MRLDSLEYFTEVARDLNITRTARRLYISQQSLSNHIARLERYYGARLLERKPKLALTHSGELVLAFARYVTRRNVALLDGLAEVHMEKRGLVRFAASAPRIDSCLPNVLSQYAIDYPAVEVKATIANTDQAHKMVLEDQIDIAITFTIEDPLLICQYVISDQIFLCVSHELLETFYSDATERLCLQSREGASVSSFSRLPFCVLNNRMGNSIAGCFEEASYSPHAHIITSSIQTGTLVGIQGQAAFFSTRTSLLNYPGFMPKNIEIFPLLRGGALLCQDLFLVYRADRYLTAYLKRFLELIQEFFRITEETPL